MVTGTQIANEILEMYKTFCDVSDCWIYILMYRLTHLYLQVGQKVDFKNV